MTPKRRAPCGPGQSEHPSGYRRAAISATCRLERGPVKATTLVVSKRGGTIVLYPQVPGACVISLDEDGAAMLDTLLSVWLG